MGGKGIPRNSASKSKCTKTPKKKSKKQIILTQNKPSDDILEDTNSNSSNVGNLCVAECHFGGHRGDTEMLKCCICMVWIHPVCCNDCYEDCQTGIYTCSICRTLGTRVVNIEKQLQESLNLNKVLFSLIEKISADCVQLRALVSKLSHNSDANKEMSKPETPKRLFQEQKEPASSINPPCSKSPSRLPRRVMDRSEAGSSWSVSPSGPQARPLCDLLATETSTRDGPAPTVIKPAESLDQSAPEVRGKYNARTSSKMTDTPDLADRSSVCNLSSPNTKPKVMVFGTSMVRSTGGIIASNLPSFNTCVHSSSGLTLKKAVEHIPRAVEDLKLSESDTLVLSLGTNDVTHRNVSDITADYQSLIHKIKYVAPSCNIMMAAVAYRLYDDSCNSKTDLLNRSLRSMCSRDSQCSFVDANPPAIDENYREDRLHFNFKGSRTFATFLVNKLKNVTNFPLPIHHYNG